MTAAAINPAAAAQRLELIRTTLKPAAQARRDAALIDYIATPNGVAEFTRQWELAPPGPARDRLAHIITTGIAAADEEYIERLTRNNCGPNDGLLRALLLAPTDDAVTTQLIEQRIMATFRQSDTAITAGTTRVRIHKLTATGHRTSTYLAYPHVILASHTTTTLTDVITETATTTHGEQRLRKLLGDNGYRHLTATL